MMEKKRIAVSGEEISCAEKRISIAILVYVSERGMYYY